MKSSRGIVAAAVVSLGLLAARPALGGVIAVTSRAALAGDQSVDWSVLGPDMTFPANPFSVTASGGLGLTVSASGGYLERSVQTPPFNKDDWNGHFATGDAVLFAYTLSQTPQPVTITFASPVFGAGAQIEENFEGPYTATMDAYDSSDVLLGSFTFNGDNSVGTTGDNSDPFAGVLSDTANIKYLVYQTVSEFPSVEGESDGTAINQLDIVTNAPAVPEPSVMALLGVGLVVLGWRAMPFRRQRA